MKSKINPFFAKFLSVATFAFAGAAQADDYTTDSTGLWSDAIWNPGLVTGPTASTDTATINAGTVTINSLTIDSAIAISSGATVVANAVANTANVTLGGNLTGAGTLTKTGGWSLLLGGDNSGFSGTINANESNVLFTADSAGSAAADWVITAGNVVNNQSGTGHVIKLGSLAGSTGRLGSNSSGSEVTFEIGGNGKTTAFSGQIVNTPPGWAGGTVSLTKVGGGTLTLSGNNTYTGTTNVNDGILALQGAGGGGTTYNGGILSINGPSTLRVTGQRYNFSGKTLTFDSVGGGTIDAIASGAGGFVFMGSNNFTTSGGAQNTISGTRIGAENQGLNLNSQNAIFNVATGTNATSDLKVTGTIWGAGSVIKNGAGRMEISAPQQYTGTTTVNEGTLVLGDGTDNVGLSDTNDVTIESDAVLQLNYVVGSPDTINKLFLEGVQMVSGTWGSEANEAAEHTSALITGDGLLDVLSDPPPADSFATWMSTNYPAIHTPDNQPGADPDNDGIANLLEYVLQGGDPSVSSTAILPTLDASGANFVFTYYRRAAATGTTQTFEYGTTLDNGSWTPVAIPDGSGVTVTPDTPSLGIDKVEITVAKGAETKLFGRLQVVK